MKLLFLFLALAAIIGVGTFLLSENQEELPTAQNTPMPRNETNPEQTGNFEVSDELARSVIQSVLDDRFNAEKATYKTANLDNAGGPELVMGAAEDSSEIQRPAIAVIQLVSLTDREGKYENLGKVEYTEWLWGPPEIKEFIELTGDSQKEILADLMYGGASSFTQGILQADFETKKLAWAQLQDQAGKQRDAVFTVASSAMHWSAIHVTDANGDDRKEITEILAQRLISDPDKTECAANVYEWGGEIFVYRNNLSQQILAQLNADCAL